GSGTACPCRLTRPHRAGKPSRSPSWGRRHDRSDRGRARENGRVTRTNTMIRIIGGRFKGRQVVGVVKDPGVRPITGRMRQSLFDILRPWVPGASFLDLYAGSGAVGLEALSRGAGTVVFVKRDPRCAKG